jgi:Family of unknown function (DUF6788)
MDPEGIRLQVQRRLTEQRILVRSLLRQREQLRGSLFARYGECGKEGCACARGERHGPYYVLSTRSGGRGGFAYLDPRRVRTARGLVDAHREFRDGMRRLGRINLELVRLLRRYQRTIERRAARRLGLPVSG